MPASIRASRLALWSLSLSEHVLVVRHDAAGRIEHVEGLAALLAAGAAVGAAARHRMADEALAAVGHAQRAVDEELQMRVLHLGLDGADLLQVQLAGQHHLAETDVLQEARLLGRADVGLGAGVELDGRQVELQQAPYLARSRRPHPRRTAPRAKRGRLPARHRAGWC